MSREPIRRRRSRWRLPGLVALAAAAAATDGAQGVTCTAEDRAEALRAGESRVLAATPRTMRQLLLYAPSPTSKPED